MILGRINPVRKGAGGPKRAPLGELLLATHAYADWLGDSFTALFLGGEPQDTCDTHIPLSEPGEEVDENQFSCPLTLHKRRE